MQANKKDTETFDDDDLDMSSGSEVDFDDDEDPDAIEVPGRFNDLFKTYYLYILTTILIEFLFCACVCVLWYRWWQRFGDGRQFCEAKFLGCKYQSNEQPCRANDGAYNKQCRAKQ